MIDIEKNGNILYICIGSHYGRGTMASRKYEALKSKKNMVIHETKKDILKINQVADEAKRVSSVAKNVSVIIADLDRQFEQATKLNKADIRFLFFATALQCIRQYLLTPFKERTTDKESAKEAHKEEGRIFGKLFGEETELSDHKRYYASLSDIICKGVPYDAQYGSSAFGLGLSGNAHRFRTLGHDPLFGWVFGTANIMTCTLTDWQFQSYHIKPAPIVSGAMRDKIVQNANTSLMLKKVVERSQAEPQALAAAVIKQRLHLKSDLYSIAGLSVPGLTPLSADLAQTLAEHGVDAANMLTVGKQATYSIFINTLVAVIHGLFYEESYGTRNLYDVRTRKILSYSNLIASASNLIAVALMEAVAVSTSNADLGKDALRYLDVGGLAVTIYRIINDQKFINQVKQEFLEKEFYRLVMGDNLEN